MATTYHCIFNLQLRKVNFNRLIMQLEQIFWKIISILRLLLSKTNIQPSYLKIYQRLIDLYSVKHKP